MALMPCCRVQWLLVILAASLTSRLAQAQSFPGSMSYPPDHYVIKGQDFNISCVVTLNQDMNVDMKFEWQSYAMLPRNSSSVTITENVVTGVLTVHNAVFSNAEELTCSASGILYRKFVTVRQTSTIHTSVAPFVITAYPGEELLLPASTPYTLQCVVTVDKNFPLRAVDVSIRYSPISLDNNNMPSEVHSDGEVDERSRTITITVFIKDVDRRFGGTYECTAETFQIQNAVIPYYKVYNRTRITMNTQSSQDSSDDGADQDLLTQLFVFSGITITLLIVFTCLVVAVIWTKRRRSRNYPVSPYVGTIPTTPTSAKSNYYSDSPEISSVNNNKAVLQPAMALHITPRLQSISSVETDV